MSTNTNTTKTHYLGIDVAKAKVDCCLLFAMSEKRKSKVFKNDEVGMAELVVWLSKNGAPISEVHALMEGTGVYHQVAAISLSNAGARISIVNPAQVKDYGKGIGVKTKNDIMDSYVLARYGMSENPKVWIPPSEEARALQLLMTRREAVLQDLRRELNRQEKSDFANSIEFVKNTISESVTFLNDQVDKLSKKISNHINAHPELKKNMALLKSIPAIGLKTGNTMLAVMSEHQFSSAEQAAAYIGVVPKENQSGPKEGRSRMTKCGPVKVRSMLYMSAITAIRFNPHCIAVYERLLKKGKSKMCAIGAVMRKLVHLCYGVIKNQKPYDPNYLNV